MACKPKPTKCLFTEDEYTYNISSLDRIKHISNNEDYKIYLNICGKLHSIPNLEKHSDCFYNGTQICLVYNNGSSQNLGVFSDSFQFGDNSNSFLLSVTGGSLCKGSNTISTNLELICSIDEVGPVLVSNSICEYNIKWVTPAVCPHRVIETSNCELKGSMFDHRKIKFKTESVQLNSFILKYNICDRISCNGDENVQFCLVNISNNQETIIGRFNGNKLTSTDGQFTSTYYGDVCASNAAKRNRVNVKLNCDYTRNKRADIEMSENNNDCVTNVTIHTNEVCPDPEPNVLNEQCSLLQNDSGILYSYNITRLMLTDRNYEIRDAANPNLVYILNVCQPILFRAGTQCDRTAVVCMRNDSVANIYQRSKILGQYGSAKLTLLQNDSLLLQFDGVICPFPQKNRQNYLASFEFICDYKAQDSQPTLVSNTDCEYYFKWETQYACPLTNDTLQATKTTKTSTITIMKDKIEKMKPTQSHISSVPPTEPNIIPSPSSTPDLIINKISPSPTPDLIINKISPSPSPDLIINKIVPTTESRKIVATSLIVPINVEVANTSALFLKNCTYEDFNMYTLPRNINISSKTGKLYSLNICNLPKTQDCKLENCLSKLKMNASNKFIEMDFHGKIKCDNGYFNSVIYMKCSEISTQPTVIKEGACSVELEWKHSAVCALLQEKPKIHPNNNELNSEKSGHITTIIISVFALLLILFASVFIFIYFWRKRHSYNSSPSCLNRCDYSRVKDSAKII